MVSMLLFVVLLLLFVMVVSWRLWRMSRWWRSRARSAKVLDEIEMEFVNDDMDDVVEDIVLSGNLTRQDFHGDLHGQPLVVAKLGRSTGSR